MDHLVYSSDFIGKVLVKTMRFKSEEDIKRLISLKVYLKRIKDESSKDAILKRLRAIFIMPTGLDSQPLDAYRIIGISTVKIMQLEEVNKLIMERATVYSMITPWARELYENWMNNHKMKESAIEMVLSLRSRGISDGYYIPESLDCSFSTIDDID